MDYRSAGVDIEKAESLIGDVKRAAKATYDENVLSGVGGFGALYELKNYDEPVLVSGTDGVGTKIMLAQTLGDFSGLGYDLVAMCVDDIVCAGAKPLFFIDYLALGKLEEKTYLTLVKSIAEACKVSGCALIGGETAELPGMYPPDEFDLAGFSVGVVEKSKILKPENVKTGQKIVGLLSSGFHSNGYSLVRKIVEVKMLDLQKDYGFGKLGKALIAPTAIYSRALVSALGEFGHLISGISHITGGGIPGNLNRVLPIDKNARVEAGSWPVPDVISFVTETAELKLQEAYKTFNMGIGMAVILDPSIEKDFISLMKEFQFESFVVGEITEGSGEVDLVFK